MNIFRNISISRFALLLFGLLLVSAPLLAGKIDSVKVYSAAMKQHLPCTVITPDSYNKKGAPLPVMYLLHGYSGWHSNWVKKAPELANLADSFQVIIICPEGGYNSWYFDSPLQPESQYASFVGREVPEYMDRNYRTIRNRNGRAITGLSMGGHGALYLAMQFPATFGMAGSMSGGVDLMGIKGKYEIIQKIGDSTGWHKYSVLHSITRQQTENLGLIIDCGVDDFFLEGNRALHQKLVDLKIPHAYQEREGGHTWDFWKQSVRYHLYFFRGLFNAAIPGPAFQSGN